MSNYIYFIKILLLNGYDRGRRYCMKKHEDRKFKDRRRVEIYSKVHLSDTQKKMIDQVYLENYGASVPYIWHQHYTAFSGRFDPFYFPEKLYITEFEPFMNLYPEYMAFIEDKNSLAVWAEGAGIRMPKILLSCVNGIYRDEHPAMITKKEAIGLAGSLGTVFCKKTVNTSSGRDCYLIHAEGGKDSISGEPVTDILKRLGNNFAVQEQIVCHESIRKLYPGSVNTFRIVTYIWKEKICVMPAIMRLGQGNSYLDNAHAGGMYIGISEDGVLQPEAYTEFCGRFRKHPDTKVIFEGYRIPLYSKVLACAYKAHCAIPQIGVINWDFTINEAGHPVLIEANCKGGGIWMNQEANGCSAFGKKTPEILRWMNQMNKLKASERVNYPYGNMREI